VAPLRSGGWLAAWPTRNSAEAVGPHRDLHSDQQLWL
jgi:hypothetical protein